jgi:excisionase family DNA binding protein
MTKPRRCGGERGLLRVVELAGLLHVSPTTVYRLVHEGQLPGVRVGGQWRFRREDCEGWLDGQPFAGRGDRQDSLD